MATATALSLSLSLPLSLSPGKAEPGSVQPRPPRASAHPRVTGVYDAPLQSCRKKARLYEKNAPLYWLQTACCHTPAKITHKLHTGKVPTEVKLACLGFSLSLSVSLSFSLPGRRNGADNPSPRARARTCGPRQGLSLSLSPSFGLKGHVSPPGP